MTNRDQSAHGVPTVEQEQEQEEPKQFGSAGWDGTDEGDLDLPTPRVAEDVPTPESTTEPG